MVKIIQTYRKFSYLDILILQYIRKTPAPCPPSEPDDLNDFPIWDAKILLKSLLFSTHFLKVLLSSNLSDNSEEEFSLLVWNSTHIAFAYVISDNAGSNGTALRLSEWKGKIKLRDRSVEEREREEEEDEGEDEEEEEEGEASKGGKERKKGNKDERKKKESNEFSKQEKKLEGNKEQR